ncbi:MULTISPECIES: hypothetical protein [Bacillus amyloliquefaciens group]|uniref:hypothetical protein n=1 Tax=Bacillus amyloliquefaciens group TaxID=1938374 RepID=UPI001CD2AA26|nr:hypothetical protein [Bacillus amyloliquefaciens]
MKQLYKKGDYVAYNGVKGYVNGIHKEQGKFYGYYRIKREDSGGISSFVSEDYIQPLPAPTQGLSIAEISEKYRNLLISKENILTEKNDDSHAILQAEIALLKELISDISKIK